MNSIHVQRMMSGLRASIRDPPEEIIPERKPRAPRKPKEEVIEPESSDSDSDSESDTSYISYEELDVIKKTFRDEPCEYVSPAGLDQTKTKKEAIQYLESKKCPKIPKIKKSAKNIKMDNGPPAPGPRLLQPRRHLVRPRLWLFLLLLLFLSLPLWIPLPHPLRLRRLRRQLPPLSPLRRLRP